MEHWTSTDILYSDIAVNFLSFIAPEQSGTIIKRDRGDHIMIIK
jgi:hypothetical protein